MPDTDDVRIDSLRPLIPPAILMEELPASEADTQLIAEARKEVAQIVTGEDDRLVIPKRASSTPASCSRWPKP
jgi:3-deoxy-7-phosphoheptulonate synthase